MKEIDIQQPHEGSEVNSKMNQNLIKLEDIIVHHEKQHDEGSQGTQPINESQENPVATNNSNVRFCLCAHNLNLKQFIHCFS